MPAAAPILAGIGTAVTGGAATGGAATAIGGLAAAGAAAGVASAASALKQAHDAKKEAKKQVTPTFDANAEKKKAAMQEAEANRRRALSETDTVRTSALGNAGTTELKKKTLLGG